MNKETHNTLVPALRFPEFQDEEGWEEKTISEIGKIITGNTPNTKERSYYGGERLFVSPSDIGEHRYINQTLTTLTEIGYSNTRHIKANSILFVCIGSTIGKIAQNKIECATNQQINSIVPFDSILNNFLYSILEYIAPRIAEMAGNHAVPIINKSAFSSILICVPSLPEQQKIANCLSSLDELIEVESQRLEALKKHKKGLMQQLFPAEGETVPQLRFPEFWDDGEWEEKNLGDVAFLTSSKRVHLADYVSKGIPFYRGKEISLLKSQNPIEDILYISEEQYEEIKEKYGVPQIGNILITAVGTLGNVYCISSNEKFYFKDGNLIWLKDISENPIFLEILLDFYRDKVLASAIGSSQKALTISALNKLTLKFPVKPEQHKIADCLSSLDEQVATQSQQIETLKVHKKGLMQQLFPTIDNQAI